MLALAGMAGMAGMVATGACTMGDGAGVSDTEGDDAGVSGPGGDDGGGDVGGEPGPWSAWISADGAVDLGPEAGLKAGRPGADLARLPVRTRRGHAIEVDLDGSVRYSPPSGFWGGDTFDYQLDGEMVLGTINVAPDASLLLEEDHGRRLLPGWGEGDAFGAGTVNVGDLDGDGDDELAVLAPGYDAEFAPNAFDHGALVVVPGRRDGHFSPGGNFITGAWAQQRLGTQACGAGDLDGDGRGELVVMGGGSLYLVSGPVDLESLAAPIDQLPTRLSITAISSGLTQDLVCGLDLVGDATPDIVVAGWYGLAVLDGALTGEHELDAVRQTVPGIDDWSTAQIAHARRLRDLDGDGKRELAVAARHWRFTGEAGVLVRLSNDASWHEVDTGVIGQFDFGDVDGDGLTDLVVAYDDSVHLFRDAFGTPDRQAFTTELGGWTRRVLLRDFDGDGRDDLLAAIEEAPRWDDYGYGRMVLLFGASGQLAALNLVDRHEFSLWGPQPYAGFARSLPALGDFDGDGVPDFAFGIPEAGITAEQSQSGETGTLGAVVVVPGFGPARPTPLSPG